MKTARDMAELIVGEFEGSSTGDERRKKRLKSIATRFANDLYRRFLHRLNETYR